MSYTITSTEKTKGKASEHETKALLYLMNFYKSSDEVYYFVIDFFNDVTGINNFVTKAFDLQSKGNKNVSPKAIGRELVTLFKNYISELDFNAYILFIGGVADSVRKDKTKTEFYWDNINPKAQTKIKLGLKEEGYSRSYIDNTLVTDENLDNFLSKVLFVIDSKEKGEYIKNIIKTNPLLIPCDEILTSIFDEIRDVQSAKKNEDTEGVIINNLDDFIPYNKHIKKNEIQLLVLNRLINFNLMDKGVPDSFIPIYNSFNISKRKDIVEDCKLSIAKTLFDKNNAEPFWQVFEDIYKNLNSYPHDSINDIYNKLNLENIDCLQSLDIISLKYFISIIKEGMYEN